MTALIEVETEDFARAARSVYSDVADPLVNVTTRLVGRLRDGAAMAGSDPGGRDWAAAYDRSAAATLGATQDVLNGCYRLSAMFAQTARNYEAADVASTAGVRHAIAAVTARLPDDTAVGLATEVPSAAGGSSSPPGPWGLIADLVGRVWPNGHQDRLRAAARAWRSSADDLWLRSEYVAVAVVPAMGDKLPEFDDMSTVCDAMYLRLRDVANAHHALADACDQLADHLDEVHSAVEAELNSLIEWTAGIELTGALLSVVTLGMAEAPTQAVEGARIARTAARVGALIERFAALASTAARTVAAVVDRVSVVSARVRTVLDVRLSAATVTLAVRVRAVRLSGELGAIGRISGAGSFPDLIAPRLALERKFKHARDFGVTARRGREGFEEFEGALRSFLNKPMVTRIHGVYRGQEVILSYERESMLVVVQTPAGEFISGWRMTPVQFQYVTQRGVLGSD